MKAKELAEELLRYPDFDVMVSVPVSTATYDHPYDKYDVRDIDSIGDIKNTDMVIVLES